MKRFVFNNKDKITFVSGTLILFAFISKFLLKSDITFEISMLIASIIGILPILIQAVEALKIKVISIDLLVTIAVIGAMIIKNYEESAIVSFLFLFGAYLEKKTLNKTRSAIKSLLNNLPETATLVLENGEEEIIDIDLVDVGDILHIKIGDKVPVDGIIIENSGYFNESSITGEPLAVSKSLNDKVFAGTIVENGSMKIKAQNVGEETLFGKIIELVEDAQDSKSQAEKFINSFAKYYTPFVLILAVIIYLITKNLETAITVLVLGCPGALVIGIPISNVAGIGNGAKNGVLFKGSEVIKEISELDTIYFDKTGTLTEGNPKLVDRIYYSDDEIDSYIFSLEKTSNHPLAAAITNELNSDKIINFTENETIKGGGIKGITQDKEVLIGNEKLMKDNKILIDENIQNDINSLLEKGDSIVITAIDKKIVSIFGIRDVIRKDIKENLKKLKDKGIMHFGILSGDNQKAVDILANELNIDIAKGNLLPQDKVKYLEENNNKIAFVGDGINDSPSLAKADVGIAMGSGTDVAIETSDVVLINSDFEKLVHAYSLAKKIISNMKQNIFIAVATVVILISGLFFTNYVTMSVGMFVHEASILLVILNALRLVNYKSWFKSII